MPTAADIEKARERIRNGTDVISSIMRMKKEATEALRTGDMAKLRAAGYHVVPFNASAL